METAGQVCFRGRTDHTIHTISTDDKITHGLGKRIRVEPLDPFLPLGCEKCLAAKISFILAFCDVERILLPSISVLFDNFYKSCPPTQFITLFTS